MSFLLITMHGFYRFSCVQCLQQTLISQVNFESEDSKSPRSVAKFQ